MLMCMLLFTYIGIGLQHTFVWLPVCSFSFLLAWVPVPMDICSIFRILLSLGEISVSVDICSIFRVFFFREGVYLYLLDIRGYWPAGLSVSADIGRLGYPYPRICLFCISVSVSHICFKP